MPLFRRAAILVFICIAACGGKTSAEVTDAATQEATTTPPASCSWSPSFDPIDAAPMRDSCRAARSILSCTGSDGTAVLCATDRAECNLPSLPGVTYTCKSYCKPTEFGAVCGDGTGSSVAPPADCPQRMTSPGGVLYCCACSM